MSTTTQAPIGIIQHPMLGPAVSGRAVYEATTTSNANRDMFSDWFRHKESKLGLIEEKDYVTTSVPFTGSSRKHIEHILSLETAQRIADILPAKRGGELAIYLKYYLAYQETATVCEPAVEEKTTQLTAPISLFESAAASPAIEPQPAPAPVNPTPLSPVQQLLAEVQKLADEEAKRQQEPQLQPEQFKAVESRLNRLEGQVSTILYFFQQASSALRSLPPAQLQYNAGTTAPLPDLEPTTRVKITRLVDGYAAAKTVTHQEVWKHLYGHLSSRFNFDAWQFAQGKKNPNYLDVVEDNGQLENLYSLAVELLTLSQR